MITAIVAYLWTKVGEENRYIETKLWMKIFIGILFAYSIANAVVLDYYLIKLKKRDKVLIPIPLHYINFKYFIIPYFPL